MDDRRLADSVRELIELLARADLPADIGALADVIEEVNAKLRGLPVISRWERTKIDGFRGYLNYSPIAGRLHPLAPPLHLEHHDDHVSGRVTFGPAYEGPPGCVHGGYLAAVLDEILGSAQALTGRPGYTGTLTVRFRDFTPLDTELVLRGVVDHVEGRKIFASATVHDRDRLTAEGEGIFLSVADVSEPDRRTS